jgi:hypothetical protein
MSCIVLGVFTDPLPSNKRPIVARVGSRGDVFTESLPRMAYTSIICNKWKLIKSDFCSNLPTRNKVTDNITEMGRLI